MKLRAWLLAALLAVPMSASAVGPILKGCTFTFSEAVVPEGDLDAFRVKIGTAAGGPYSFVTVVPSGTLTGGVTITTGNLCTSLANGQKYAVVTAVDLAGNESGPSNEVAFFLDTVAPPVPSNTSVK